MLGNNVEEINKLRQQFAAGNWKKFIKSIKISNIHGWYGQEISFNFPVCAIVGENGIGKSTFLKAAACAYQNSGMQTFYPSKMFVKTQWDQNYINGAYIEYVIQEGANTKQTHWKKTKDWGYTPKKKPERNVYFLDISRTLPLDATAGYAKIAKQSVSEMQASATLDEKHLSKLSYVLNKPYEAARFVNTDINPNRDVGILKNTFGEVSQFHQGAGEDATLDLFKILQIIPNQSLLIIDEVEASLHPLAQRRLTRFLLELSRIKKIQIILSTHSTYVLDEIPPEGRIMLMKLKDRKEVLYNISAKFALNSIDEINHPELYIYVEDEEAGEVIRKILTVSDNSLAILNRIAIQPIGSYTVVDTVAGLISENKLPYNGIAFVDGDKINECNNDCVALPGDAAPEKQILNELKNHKWCGLDDRFGIEKNVLYQIFDDAMLIPDHHMWTEYIGNKIKQSKEYVWSVLVKEWCKYCLDEDTRERIYNAILDKLKK